MLKKYTIAFAAGVASAQDEAPSTAAAPSKQPVWGLRSVKYHDDDMKTITEFADHATTNANMDAGRKAEEVDYMYDTDPASAFPSALVQTDAEINAPWRHSDTWQLRSVQDYRFDQEVQKAFMEHSVKTANAKAQKKAEKRGYIDGDYEDKAEEAFVQIPEEQSDYEFVMTPEGGLFMQTKEDTHEVWKLRSVGWHDDDQNMIRGFGDNQTDNANDESKAKAEKQSYEPATWGNVWDVQTGDDVPYDSENVQLGKWYTLFDQDANVDDHGYTRATTARFSSDSDDVFMRSMIEQYALEEGACDEDADGNEINCKPSGKFWMDKLGTQMAAQEVLETHKGLSGPALNSYMDAYFEKAWGHFDVNLTGYVEVIKMPQLMRFLCSDQRMQLGESGQTGDIAPAHEYM